MMSTKVLRIWDRAMMRADEAGCELWNLEAVAEGRLCRLEMIRFSKMEVDNGEEEGGGKSDQNDGQDNIDEDDEDEDTPEINGPDGRHDMLVDEMFQAMS